MALVNALGDLSLDRPSATGDAHMVSGTKLRYRREFNDPTLNDWDVVTGTGMAVAVASSNLTVTTGTTTNSTTTLTSKQTFTAPFKSAFGFKISQKIANQEFYVEIVKCDAITGVVDETVVAAWRVAGTDSVTTTIGRVEVRNGGAARTQSANITVPTQTTDAIYEIVLESDEVSFHTKPVNSTSSRSASTVYNSIAPSPTATYKLRYRIVNGGTAPASTTTFTSAFVTAIDYTEIQTELTGGPGTSTAASALPVIGAGGTFGATATQSTGSATTIWNAAGYGGFLVADIASAAITATATSGTISPGQLANIGTYSHTFNVAVTAITGTGAFMDVAVEESPDNGTNWIRVYEFPRITATGSFTSPKLRATYGTRFRYVRTVGGTTPSITNAVNRVMWSTPGELTRQWFDRTISLTTLSSVTPTYLVDGCNFFQVTTNLGATTTAPVLQFQGSEDGTNFYNMGPTFTPTGSLTTVSIIKDFAPKFGRVAVQTAGSSVTMGYISVKALGA